MEPLFILAVPHRRPPSAYICSDRADFISRMYEAAARSEGEVYTRTTIASELDVCDYTLADAQAESAAGADPDSLCGLAARLPPETVIYRADWIMGPGLYSTEDPGAFEAAVAYAGHDESAFYVCEGLPEAKTLLKTLRGPNAPRIGQCGPLRAADALARLIRQECAA